MWHFLLSNYLRESKMRGNSWIKRERDVKTRQRSFACTMRNGREKLSTGYGEY